MRLDFRPLSVDEEEFIREGFSRHAEMLKAPQFMKEPIAWTLYDDNKMAASLSGSILWDWLYIDVLYVDEAYRGQDLGTELMEKAEKHAKDRCLTGLYLTTQSWQAAPFYEKMGYEEYAVLDDFPKGYKRHCFRKYLER